MSADLDLLAPATFVIACGHSMHGVTWRDGRIELDDHDLAAERTLIALGAERCACVEVADLVAHVGEDWPTLRHVLRGAETRPTTTIERAAATGRHRARVDRETAAVNVSTSPARPARRHRTAVRRARLATAERRELVRHLPHGLRLRLAVAAAAERSAAIEAGRHPTGDVLDMTTVRGLLTPVVRRTVGAPVVAVACRLAGPGEPAMMTARPRGAAVEVFARLPLRWISDVWAAGLGGVDGHVVADVVRRGATDEVDALAYRWADGVLVAERVRLQRSDGRWTGAAAGHRT